MKVRGPGGADLEAETKLCPFAGGYRSMTLNVRRRAEPHAVGYCCLYEASNADSDDADEAEDDE